MATKTNDLAQVNPTTGHATLIGPMGLTDSWGMAFGSDGVLYGTSTETQQVFAANLSTGAGTLVSTLSGIYGIWGAASTPPASQTALTASAASISAGAERHVYRDGLLGLARQGGANRKRQVSTTATRSARRRSRVMVRRFSPRRLCRPGRTQSPPPIPATSTFSGSTSMPLAEVVNPASVDSRRRQHDSPHGFCFVDLLWRRSDVCCNRCLRQRQQWNANGEH